MAALRNSLSKGDARPGLVHHTDRGSPYASAEYRDLLEEHGALPSMSRPRDCWDNAVAESFFSTLTAELLARRRFPSPEQAAAEIADYIDGFYNLARRHSTIGYVSPIEYELRHLAAALAALTTCLRNRVKATPTPFSQVERRSTRRAAFSHHAQEALRALWGRDRSGTDQPPSRR